MSQTQDPPRSREKLRESCNTCASSKVRCSKDQPSCVRCSNRQLYCHYSPSRRTGKRRAVSDDPVQSASKAPDTVTITSDSHAYEKQTRVKHASTADVLGPSTATHILSDLHLDAFNNDAYFAVDSNAFIADSDLDPFDYSLPTSSDSADGSMDNNLLDFGALLTPSNFDGMSTLLGGICPDSTPTEAAASSPPFIHPQTCSNRSAEKPRDCMGLALDTLQSLHMAPSTCSLASGFTATSVFSVDPTIEHVLATNRAVLDSVSIILSCYCSLNAQLALVVTLIGSKLLAWYRAVLKPDDQVQHADTSHGGLSRDLDMVAERVLHLPVTVGRYKLDGADRGKMRAQLVLSELRHVVKLVEQLAKHFGDDGPGIRAAPEGVKKNNTGVTELCEQLQRFLKDGVQSVTKEAIRILRET
ncbi:MAG: hypothetical protein LQ352_006412 [Teloschistes flavicans]|nr:MAG: hypothetical protein LQ352_006412 [Teloschistes flavicans]